MYIYYLNPLGASAPQSEGYIIHLPWDFIKPLGSVNTLRIFTALNAATQVHIYVKAFELLA